MAWTAMQDVGAYFTPEQVKRIILVAKDRSDRDFVLILMLWHTGRRIGEVLRVRKKHIDFDHKQILFHILKKRHNKDMKKRKAIDDVLCNVLIDYTRNMEDDNYIFPSPYIKGKHLSKRQAYNIVRDSAETAGILYVGDGKPPHPHTFRHSFSINFIRNCKNESAALIWLQNILDHSNIKMTSEYLQFSQKDIKKELNKIYKKEV